MDKINNFEWLTGDIDNSLVLKVVYKKDNIYEEYGVFNIGEVLETPCDELDVASGNIYDMTNLLTLGVVRFVNVSDRADVLEIPFKKMYFLYKNSNILGEEEQDKLISFGELDTFSIIDGTIRNDLLVFSAVINEPTDDLKEVMKVAAEYGEYGMQEKTDALRKITVVNHRRIVNDRKTKTLK